MPRSVVKTGRGGNGGGTVTVNEMIRMLVTIRLVGAFLGLIVIGGSVIWAVWECRDIIADWIRRKKGR